MEILRMKIVRGTPRQADGAAVTGVFMAQVGEIILEGCQIVRRADGTLFITLPSVSKLSRNLRRSARFAHYDKYHEFRRMALDAFAAAGGSLEDDLDDYGSVRRVLGAEDEALEMAGF